MAPGVTIALRERDGHLAAAVDGATALPVETLLIGRPVDEAVAILPRLFNLCRSAQEAAVRLALGLPLPPGLHESLRAEILRDHMMRLFLTWPRRLGLAPRPFPPRGEAAAALFGPSGRCPATPEAFETWLAAAAGTAPLVAAIATAFAPGEATAALPDTTAETVFDPRPQENTTAGRYRGHPLLDALAASHGRGPLWRTVARLVDAGTCLAGPLPEPQRLADGTAVTPAARGLYAVRARAEAGRIAAFARVTPTDHLLATGGALDAALATLPATRAALAPLAVDILDPCVPYDLREVAHA